MGIADILCPMILSSYRIDFTSDSGKSTRLLDYGDGLREMPVFAISQSRATGSGVLGAKWGRAQASGGARRTLGWSRMLEHATPAAAESYAQSHSAGLTDNHGTIRVSVNGSEVWDFHDATLLDVTCLRNRFDGDSATDTRYQLDCGHTLPVSGLAWYEGIPAEWVLRQHGLLLQTHEGDPTTAEPFRPHPLKYRVTEEEGPNGLEKWFEFGFTIDARLSGSAADGWTDPFGFVSITPQRTEDMENYTSGEFGDCVGSPTENDDGTFDYWFRSIYPIDSAIKTGVIIAQSPTPPYLNSDARNNPFTALTLGNVPQSLPNFPYTMPGDAAQMQADIRALGWTGATVTSTSNLEWAITIYGVEQSDYHDQSKVFWPMYLVPNMFGEIVNPCDGRYFQGQFVNQANVRTHVFKQFARLVFSPGPNPLPEPQPV